MMSESRTTKYCSACERTLGIECFAQRFDKKTKAFYRRSICRQCHNAKRNVGRRGAKE